MSGRVCLITGATSGIGKAAAAELARRGAHIVLVGRNASRCKAVADEIRASTDKLNIEYFTADLSSQAQVRCLAQEVLARHSQLHVLINNAGAIFALRQESVDKIEMTLALNHLSSFLLTNLLLDALRNGSPARIINVSSSAHDDISAFNFDDPHARTSGYPTTESKSLLYTLLKPWAHPAFIQYAHSKLANILFTRELARRLQGTGVTVNAMHPGLVATSFTSGNGVFGWFMRRWMSLFGISPDQGANTIVYLACSPQVAGVTGEYFVKEKIAPSSQASADTVAARRLWELCERLTQLPSVSLQTII